MSKCLWCGDVLLPRYRWTNLLHIEDRRGFCEGCWSKFGRADGSELCKKCGRDLKVLPSDFVKDHVCADCQAWISEGDILAMNRSLFTYNVFMRHVIIRFKFRGDAILAEGFLEPWRGLYRKYFKDCIPVPIPLSAERLAERHFNQAQLLASLLPTPPANILVRTKHSEKQSKKTRRERMSVEENPFALADGAAGFAGKSIVIIDDIYTTGTTVRHAAHILKELTSEAIFSMTLAR